MVLSSPSDMQPASPQDFNAKSGDAGACFLFFPFFLFFFFSQLNMRKAKIEIRETILQETSKEKAFSK